MDAQTWVVLWPVGREAEGHEPDVFGPFVSEDECYAFAARVSVEPNDWRPVRVIEPDSVA